MALAHEETAAVLAFLSSLKLSPVLDLSPDEFASATKLVQYPAAAVESEVADGGELSRASP
jgi:hypothetical protein